MDLKKIWFYLSSLWTRIFGGQKAIDPTSEQTHKEKKMNTIAELKTQLQSRDLQVEITRWVNGNLRPLADIRLYELLCQQTVYEPTVEDLRTIYFALKPDIGLGEPGHDLGHSSRDAMAIAALIGTDPVIATAHPNDVVAGFLAGIYHDIGNSIWPRYEDTKWECGHAEIGAWHFYQRTNGLLPDHIRLLVAYNIACHTHMLNPVNITGFGQRQPWTDHLTYNLKRPVRVGVWLTRFADRLDTNGVTLFARHIPASIMGSFYGGKDFTGSAFYELNGDALRIMIKPEVATVEVKGSKTPTTLQHITNFANSSFNLSAYSQHDDIFPSMKRLMDYKANQGLKLAMIVSESAPKASEGTSTYDLFWKFLVRVSCTPSIEEARYVFDHIWAELSTEEQEKWLVGLNYANHAYDQWLKMLITDIQSSKVPLIQNFAEAILPDVKSTLGI